MKQVFTRFYVEHLWDNGGESRSGLGSSLQATAKLRGELPALFHEYRIRSILDIPCGDFNWMRMVPLDAGISYIGADIVDQIIADNRQKYLSPERKFVVLDITRSKLPRVDLVLCRDCLFHLALQDIFRALENIKRSRSTYLLTTTFTHHMKNQDVETGGWRTLNLEQAPFFFPPPTKVIAENPTSAQYPDKSLGLWRVADIPA